MGLLRKTFLVILLACCSFYSWSQCGSGALPAVPTNSWVGYVYDGVNNFSTSYQGSITETQIFDQSTWPDNATFNTTNGCAVNTETFSVRFSMNQTFACGYYTFTVGADDGVRLSLDGGATYIIDQLHDQSYTTYTTTLLVSGLKNMVLDYYENGGQNRVSYTVTAGATVTTSSGGTVAADQSSCATGFDPVAFTSSTPAGYCSNAAVTGYQWEKSTTSSSSGFANIGGATALTYDDPGPVNVTTWYRRRATDGTTPVYSNVLTVTIDPPPGSQTVAGSNVWIGYVYDGANNFASANFQGTIAEAQTFDEGFCGDNCTTAINGCDINSETFSVRFRMDYTFAGSPRDFTFTAGGDDGYRFSTDGGATWLINNYGDHAYASTNGTATLNAGTYNFILEYYENTGQNRVTFTFSSVLPVTWSYFDGYFLNGDNFIEWRTATEINNDGFVVERSTDGKTFDSLSFVDGKGTADVANRYEYQDANPFPGWNYYRLKQIDHDRKYEYSRLIPVYSEVSGATAIYPNPTTDDLYVSHVRPEQNIGVALRGVTNGKFYTLPNDPKQPSKFSLKNVAPGMYLVTITIDGELHSEKLIVY